MTRSRSPTRKPERCRCGKIRARIYRLLRRGAGILRLGEEALRLFPESVGISGIERVWCDPPLTYPLLS